MIWKFIPLPVLACGLAALLLGLFTLGPYMHETDQGILLAGGVAISQGHLVMAQGDFNFDKQFISYLLLGGLFRLFPAPLEADTLVLAGNLLAMIFFWGSFLLLLARSRRHLPLALTLPVILTPAFLVHSPFFASAFISGAWVLLLAALLDRKRWTGPAHAAVFALAFCAVGARVDALFLLPLLAMLHSPRRTMVSVLKSPNTWLMAAAGLTAFFLGRAFYTSSIRDFEPLPFQLKRVIVCVVFGLGGTGVVLLAAGHALWEARRANRDRVWLLFLAAGLALPLGYYGLQMLSPRHCVTGALSALVFIAAKSGRAIFQLYFRRQGLAAGVKLALFAAALAPVLAGVDLNDVRHPRFTLTRPTLLPSPAGVFPLGAYLAHALNFGDSTAWWIIIKPCGWPSKRSASNRQPMAGFPFSSRRCTAI